MSSASWSSWWSGKAGGKEETEEKEGEGAKQDDWVAGLGSRSNVVSPRLV